MRRHMYFHVDDLVVTKMTFYNKPNLLILI
uniref:Uncharacterized protein n=1 Tax=Arundo donax TaxID=35708 RepID=A0A0A9AYM2_ARUDO